jgi:F-type H+-transporting ATPase subunit a
MDIKQMTPDVVVYWQSGVWKLNATIVWTWAVMLGMILGSWLITRRLRTDENISRWQNLLEVVVDFIRREIRGIAQQSARPFLPFIGTMFLFVAICNALTIVPYYIPPTASLSTAAALATCTFVAVPIYGIVLQGVGTYLKHYVEPTIFMLPFNIISELSRTLALAVRLFGNIMSGAKIVAILLALTPFIFPIVFNLLGLLTGLIQAYIFAILSTVYIASGVEALGQEEQEQEKQNLAKEGAS